MVNNLTDGSNRYRMGEHVKSRTWYASDYSTSWLYDRRKNRGKFETDIIERTGNGCN